MVVRRRFNNLLFDAFDLISFLIFVAGIVLFIRFFVANPYTVVGASMSPTFSENDFNMEVTVRIICRLKLLHSMILHHLFAEW